MTRFAVKEDWSVSERARKVVAPEVMQAEFTAKHPPERVMPRSKVDVAEGPVTLRYWVSMPAVKVEVALPETVRVVPTLRAPVVVEFVVVEFPAVKFPTVVEPVEKRLATVARPVDVMFPTD